MLIGSSKIQEMTATVDVIGFLQQFVFKFGLNTVGSTGHIGSPMKSHPVDTVCRNTATTVLGVANFYSKGSVHGFLT